MSEIVPALTIVVGVSLVWLIASAPWSIFVPERRLWPPRVRQGFLYHFNAVLSPGINFGLFGLSLLSWNSGPFEHWARFVVGVLLFAAGAYLALGGVFTLGARRTQGHAGELIDSGPYRHTRNPQYVGAMFAYVSVAILCNSAPGFATALLASVWMALIPFSEEPWLREKLGAPYEEYAARVPRFLGFRRQRS